MKLLITGLLVILSTDSTRGGRPRVYNALISTNQELLPSRAYPAVAPVIGQPLYVTSSVEIHHKQSEAVDPRQPYQEPPYEYQGQEIEDESYDSYDDQQYQGYGGEELQDDVVGPPQDSRRNSHLSQELRQESVRVTHEVSRHAARPPALQNNGRKPFLLPRNHQFPPKEDSWDEPPPTSNKRPAQRPPLPDSRSRPSQKPSQAPPPPTRGQPGLPPSPSDFFTLGGVPLNNQPANIPVVPPPPIPVRFKPTS